jgi:hypothetical protein
MEKKDKKSKLEVFSEAAKKAVDEFRKDKTSYKEKVLAKKQSEPKKSSTTENTNKIESFFSKEKMNTILDKFKNKEKQ